MDLFTKDAPVFDSSDIEANKAICGVSFLSILFFLPLVACPSSRFGRYTANQSLLLFICMFAVNAVFGVLNRLPIINWVSTPVYGLVSLLLLAVMIICLVLTIQGKPVKLPVIGGITLIKW